jgi:hypothetical protein
MVIGQQAATEAEGHLSNLDGSRDQGVVVLQGCIPRASVSDPRNPHQNALACSVRLLMPAAVYGNSRLQRPDGSAYWP